MALAWRGDGFAVSRFVFINDSRSEHCKICYSLRVLNFTSSFSVQNRGVGWVW